MYSERDNLYSGGGIFLARRSTCIYRFQRSGLPLYPQLLLSFLPRKVGCSQGSAFGSYLFQLSNPTLPGNPRPPQVQSFQHTPVPTLLSPHGLLSGGISRYRPPHGTSEHRGLDRVLVFQAPIFEPVSLSLSFHFTSQIFLDLPFSSRSSPPPHTGSLAFLGLSPEQHSKHRPKPASRIYVRGVCSLGTVPLQGRSPQPHLHYRAVPQARCRQTQAAWGGRPGPRFSAGTGRSGSCTSWDRDV